jgi:hypothetical protein
VEVKLPSAPTDQSTWTTPTRSELFFKVGHLQGKKEEEERPIKQQECKTEQEASILVCNFGVFSVIKFRE